MITITKRSTLTGQVHTMELPITENAYLMWANSDPRPLVQDAFPQLSADDREFLISGITPEEWEEAFNNEDAFIAAENDEEDRT